MHWDEFMRANNYHYAKQLVKCYCYKIIEVPTVFCESLSSAMVVVCESKTLAALLLVAPNLNHICIRLSTPIDMSFGNAQLVRIEIANVDREHPSFTPMPIHDFESQYYPKLRKLEISFDLSTTLKWLDTFLSCTPNLTHLCIIISRTYEVFSFTELHRVLETRLPNLKQENLHFSYCCLPKSFDLEKHRNIGTLFQTMKYREFRSGPMTLLNISVNWTRSLS